MASMNGTINRLASDKGFGFILAGDGCEYFFHNSACLQTVFDDLQEGQAVTFDLGQEPKGSRGEVPNIDNVVISQKRGNPSSVYPPRHPFWPRPYTETISGISEVIMVEKTAKRTAPMAEATVPVHEAPNTVEQDVADRAYDLYLYLARGREHGNDVDDWLQAEGELAGDQRRRKTRARG